jgi:hypothetical protein
MAGDHPADHEGADIQPIEQMAKPRQLDEAANFCKQRAVAARHGRQRSAPGRCNENDPVRGARMPRRMVQHVGRPVPGRDDAMGAGPELGEGMAQEGRKRIRRPAQLRPRRRAKPRPIERDHAKLRLEPRHQRMHLGTRGDRAQGRQQEQQGTAARLVQSERDIKVLP